MGMISGAWQNTKLVCANHKDPLNTPMNLVSNQTGVYYACSQCGEVRGTGCQNRLDIPDYEKMLSIIADKIIEADKQDIVKNLKGTHWKRKNIVFQILEHQGDQMVVSVLNKKVIS